jgi:hypothetical protein
MGEVVVEDLQSGRILRGAEAFGRVCHEIPMYAAIGALLKLPRFRSYIDRELSGCGGDACAR